MRPGPTTELIQRIELIEGRAADESLRVLYGEQGWTIPGLCERWHCNNRTVMRLMKWFGVKPRDNRERVLIQWAENDARRKQASQVLRKTALQQSATGHHPRQGKTKDTDEGARRTAEKLKSSSSAFRPEVRAKMVDAKRKLHEQDPSTHINARTPPTRIEGLLLQKLAEWGFNAVHNRSFFPYWVDIFLPEIDVGIECFGSQRLKNMEWTRHAELCARGVRLLYVANRVIDADNLGDLHQHLTNFQVFSPNPAAQSQEAVIWGCRDFSLFRGYPDNLTIKRTYLGGLYRLDISTPAEHLIAAS